MECSKHKSGGASYHSLSPSDKLSTKNINTLKHIHASTCISAIGTKNRVPIWNMHDYQCVVLIVLIAQYPCITQKTRMGIQISSLTLSRTGAAVPDGKSSWRTSWQPFSVLQSRLIIPIFFSRETPALVIISIEYEALICKKITKTHISYMEMTLKHDVKTTKDESKIRIYNT